MKSGVPGLAPSLFISDNDEEEKGDNGKELESGKYSRYFRTKLRLFDLHGYETELKRQCFLTTQFNVV